MRRGHRLAVVRLCAAVAAAAMMLRTCHTTPLPLMHTRRACGCTSTSGGCTTARSTGRSRTHSGVCEAWKWVATEGRRLAGGKQFQWVCHTTCRSMLRLQVSVPAQFTWGDRT